MQVFCKKTLHIINADCRKGNACMTVFLELRKEFLRGAKAFRGVCPEKRNSPGKVRRMARSLPKTRSLCTFMQQAGRELHPNRRFGL